MVSIRIIKMIFANSHFYSNVISPIFNDLKSNRSHLGVTCLTWRSSCQTDNAARISVDCAMQYTRSKKGPDCCLPMGCQLTVSIDWRILIKYCDHSMYSHLNVWITQIAQCNILTIRKGPNCCLSIRYQLRASIYLRIII